MQKVPLLLVDDEAPLVALLRKFLERNGFAVESEETGGGGIARVEAEPELFRAVVLDLGLPDMDGAEALPMILAASESVRVLVSSGTPFSSEAVDEANRGRVGVMLKPYMPQELLSALAELGVAPLS
jgi:two-component system OmpR family response regulator